MSDQPEHPAPPQHVTLPVLPNSGKVEQLRKEAAADQAAASPKPVDSTLVSRYLDAKKTPQQKAIEEKVIDAIKLVYDPEIPVNIYDLGLIYGITVDPATNKVDIRMTLTAPGCPVAGELIMDVQRRVENIDEVPSADVELVWDPPWDREMMSEVAKLELGML